MIIAFLHSSAEELLLHGAWEDCIPKVLLFRDLDGPESCQNVFLHERRVCLRVWT